MGSNPPPNLSKSLRLIRIQTQVADLVELNASKRRIFKGAKPVAHPRKRIKDGSGDKLNLESLGTSGLEGKSGRGGNFGL